MSKICFGCGAKLQDSDPTKEGYIPTSKLENSDYCKRCFRLIHYGEVKKSERPKSTSEIVKTINKHAGFVVFMVDFINIFDSIMEVYDMIKVPKILVVSKSDIIPKNVSFTTIKTYLKTVYKVHEDILFTSNKSNFNTLLKELYNRNDIYFLGLTNTGKSTIINGIASILNTKAVPITTSYKENTTLDFIRIKIGDKTYIDSPGFLISCYEAKDETRITSAIKPITYQNKTDSTYTVGQEFDIRVNGNTNIIFYFGDKLKIKRAYKKKVEGETVLVKGGTDVVIAGLGFFKVTMEASLVIPLSLMPFVNIRTSLVGGVHE